MIKMNISSRLLFCYKMRVRGKHTAEDAPYIYIIIRDSQIQVTLLSNSNSDV